MTLHRARFIVRDAGFEHGAAGLVLSATTEPPPARPAKNIYMLVSHQKPDNRLDATVYYRKFTIHTMWIKLSPQVARKERIFGQQNKIALFL